MTLSLHRVQLMRPTRCALAGRAPWMLSVAAAFFAVALALLGAGVIPGPPAEALGWALVALGIAYSCNAAAADGAQARGLLCAVGAAYAVSGSLLVVDPVLGRLLLLAAVAMTFVPGGIVLAVDAATSRHARWPTAAVSGIAIAVFGAAVAVEWPFPAVSALAITFGLAAAAQGTACLRLARAGQRLSQKNLLGLRKNPSTRQPSGARATCLLPFGRQT
ncbi:MAG TPA: hypothetical protein VLC47_11635 [Burkholderiales bacterium]|nr:hypothetical protein [Burkholderiales bacterium]